VPAAPFYQRPYAPLHRPGGCSPAWARFAPRVVVEAAYRQLNRQQLETRGVPLCALRMAGGRPSILTPEMLSRAAEMARQAPTLRAIGHALGVKPATVRDWIRKGEQPDAPPLHAEFAAAIHGALADAEMVLVAWIAAGEPKDCAWRLTHLPFLRADWSDAAATRRAMEAYAARFGEVLMACSDLTAEGRYRLLVALGAAPVRSRHADRDRQAGRRLLREWLAEPEG
jgi:hypothetical protein